MKKNPAEAGFFSSGCQLQAAFRLTAEILPFAPVCVSNETFWFSLSEPRPAASTAEMCTNTSFWPFSGWMNPKPLDGLKNFTVPMVDIVSSQCWRGRAQPRAASKERVGEDRRTAGKLQTDPKRIRRRHYTPESTSTGKGVSSE